MYEENDIDLCPVCGEGTLLHQNETRVATPAWRDFSVKVMMEYSVCDICMSEIANAEQMKRNKQRMDEAIENYLEQNNGEL